jgi:hypothetical protein
MWLFRESYHWMKNRFSPLWAGSLTPDPFLTDSPTNHQMRAVIGRVM